MKEFVQKTTQWVFESDEVLAALRKAYPERDIPEHRDGIKVRLFQYDSSIGVELTENLVRAAE